MPFVSLKALNSLPVQSANTNWVNDTNESTWFHTIHSQSGVGSCEDSVQWPLSKPSQPRPPSCMSQSQTAVHLKPTNNDHCCLVTLKDLIFHLLLPICYVQLDTWNNYIHQHTIEDVVSRMHLTELCHVFDWVTTGRGGANAGFTCDTNSLQSVRNTPREVKSRIISIQKFNRNYSKSLETISVLRPITS